MRTTYKQELPNTAWCVLKSHRLLAGESPVLVPRKKRGAGGSGRQVAGNRCSRATGYVEALYPFEKKEQSSSPSHKVNPSTLLRTGPSTSLRTGNSDRCGGCPFPVPASCSLRAVAILNRWALTMKKRIYDSRKTDTDTIR